MTRTKPKKYNLTRKNNKVKVLNPGSKPGKWDESMIFRAMMLAIEGITEKKIAIALNVHEHTINYWKRTKPEFLEALQRGKAQYTERVEQSLVESAVGYSHPDTHFAVIDGEVIQTPTMKHYPPNVTAQIFFLKNRAPNRWQDVHRLEGSVQHRHILDLTKLSDKELKILENVGLVELPEHGDSND